ncbi:flagellar hook capping FlgD N-terminal domain-containing protein [Cognatishimia sp. 1_MG-2023]|uniref:flagellar hook capping FlgD N-terminal domain-containing protein n=1 Tax=Cognatishimia sp. 1_MG-2023 TaxID=3062642 RepID=UPI0026E18263|nr:flagellar hook capping FlgD N-terminal domain-containing protein [Cognatishimia sp. 1_MG-2023]MDO6726952.1 flagellar hook capping FlgD N-terminal domain-containing protein [Cognatishimia sp. 1_MG-2023]
MQVTNTQSTTTQATASPVISSDFETFLKMLTAQMQNQDPLNPIESSDFATQLATFSAVEQQVLTNDLLKNLQTQFSAMDMSQMAGWVGMEAKVLAPGYYDGNPIDLMTYPLSTADSAELVVTNEDGDEITRFAIPIESDTMQWDGTDADGNAVADGLYTFTVESTKDDEVVESLSAEVYSRVTEARTTSQGVYLVLEGGSIVHSNDVSGLREAV